MLNEVLIEGFVSGRSWTYSNDQYFRLASYRDRHRPPRRKENRDEPDYVTVRLQSNGLPVTLQSGMKVRVQGYLQSRYYDETLDEWLKNAKGPTNALSAGSDLRKDLKHNRVINEIVGERLIPLAMPEPREAEADAGDDRSAKNGKRHSPLPVSEPAPLAEAPSS